MGIIRKFTGDWNKVFSWDGARTRKYQDSAVNQVSETWMIGKEENAQNFAFRYYQIEPGGYSRKEQHPYDHGILILPFIMLNSSWTSLKNWRMNREQHRPTSFSEFVIKNWD